ncbi:MAG: flagellar hook-basal body complex protein, partial [Desulfobulbaceae bacterium]|nr:flagellar hook-basal body complex protein [Desulfobulbaceae bacterium]
MTGSIGVMSDNVANVNTTAFKSSKMNFADLLSLTSNIGQIGNGSHLGHITQDYKPGQMSNTNRSTDMAINGNGFFMLRAENINETIYTRDGQFRAAEITGNPDAPYKLVNPQGYFVQGTNTGSLENPTGTIEDIIIQRESLPKATESVLVALNLQSDSLTTELTEEPLYSSWDGTNQTGKISDPIGDDKFSYVNPIRIYSDNNEDNEIDLNIYFDQTTQDNKREFLVTCDPTQDQRLIGNTGIRYNADGTTVNKGAGALLYGTISFNPQGEMDQIHCWNVPADGNLTPTSANEIDLARGEGFFSFEYNTSGVGPNLSTTLSFGNEPAPQSIHSPTAAMIYDENDTPSALLYENTDWSKVYDVDGNKAQSGDIINFTGSDGEGTAVSFNYTVDFNNTVADLLSSISGAFNSDASIVKGILQLKDNEIGDSQLAINSISYLDSNGNSPATNTNLAQIFGPEGTNFDTTPENRAHPGPISTTNYANDTSTLYQVQDGYGRGYIDDVQVSNEGVVTSYYSNGVKVDQAQLALADFVNYGGLRTASGNNFLATDEAGEITITTPGEDGVGKVTGNALEMSNVDLARQ